MNRISTCVLMVVVLAVTAGWAVAENFRSYSDDQLRTMQHSIRNDAPERQEAYEQEVHRRFGSTDMPDGHANGRYHEGYHNDMETHDHGDHMGSTFRHDMENDHNDHMDSGMDGTGYHDGNRTGNHDRYNSRRGGGGGC